MTISGDSPLHHRRSYGAGSACVEEYDAHTQRQRFKRLIVELFPLDRVEAFLATHLEAGIYPHVQALHFDAGLLPPLENPLAREAEPAPFDLEAERIGKYGKARGHALGEASRSSLNAEQVPSFGFFFTSWNQASLITVLYPSIALHPRPRIELGGQRIDEPAFTRPLMSEVMSWLTAKGFFAGQATVKWHGYDARLSCAATGMLNQALGKRGWLNTIFDKVVEHQRIPRMSITWSRSPCARTGWRPSPSGRR